MFLMRPVRNFRFVHRPAPTERLCAAVAPAVPQSSLHLLAPGSGSVPSVSRPFWRSRRVVPERVTTSDLHSTYCLQVFSAAVLRALLNLACCQIKKSNAEDFFFSNEASWVFQQNCNLAFELSNTLV
ncbi:hypothetical protein ElyMa_002396700 [Elysia marginata]|uniref:Uncharacterized protein n=1 Tax=Elysia marginata TaxID=1093978 RepID=A0AAV4GE93_9GAST|nr:hypothetical protein ElyMa_002396700 [Elysia marginata]